MNIRSNITVENIVTAATGFQIVSAATAGHYLRHNGTNYIDGTIETNDLPALGANPTSSIGLTAVNGSASTYLRSDSSPALSVAITPTWTGTHTFSNATYSALFSGGPVGVGVATPTAGLDIETVPASSKTFFKAGSVCPVYLVGSAAGSGSPAVGMNLYYDTAWKFGKGSSSNWGGALSFDYTSGTLAWYISSAAGTAAGAATLASVFAIDRTGLVNIPALTALRLVVTDGSSNLSSVAAGTNGEVLTKVAGAIAWAAPSGGGAVSSVFTRTGAVVAATNDYTWAQINKTTSSLADITTRSAADLSSGNLAVARLNSGTNAGATTYWRGDGSWSTPAGVQRLHTDATNHFDTTGSSTNVDLGSYTLPADQLQAVGDSFHAEFIGKQTNTVQTKNLNLYFNGVDYGGFTNTTATDWAFVVDGVVTNATAANSTVRLTYRLYLGSTFSVVVNDVTGLDLSTTKVLKLVSNTVSTGTTPYNEEYIFLCDFIAAP